MGSWTMIVASCTLFVFAKMTAGEMNDVKVSKKDPTKRKPSVDICLSSACLDSASRILSSMNSSVNPCDDFYEFACGNFAKSATIPTEFSRVSPSQMAGQKVLSRFQQIIDDIDEFNVPKHFRLVKTYYRKCMDWGLMTRESVVNSALIVIENRNGWPLYYPSTWNETVFDYGFTFKSLFTYRFAPDISNSKFWIPQIQEKNPPLNRHYLKEGFSNEVVQAYYQYMIDIAIALGIDESRAKISLNETLFMEIELYQTVFTKHDELDSYERLSKMKVKKLKRKYEYLVFPRRIRNIDGRAIQLAVDLETLDRVENWMSKKSKRALANWEAWRVIAENVHLLGDDLLYRTNVFNQIYRGTLQQSRSSKCVEETLKFLGFALGALYQREYIGRSSVDDLILMLDNIKQQFSGFIGKTEWLDVDTKRNAVEKVLNIKSSLATCRDFVLDNELETFYRDLELSDDSYEEIWANVTDFEAINEPHKTTFKRTARINCGRFLRKSRYLRQLNFFQLAAGVYTDFFYDIDRPKYLNYGAAGATIGHEIAHSLGVQGRHYDKNGNLKPWSNSESNEKYVKRIECFVDQYEKYTINEPKTCVNAILTEVENIGGNTDVKGAYSAYSVNDVKIHVNGQSTLTENVADNTGLKAAYHAYINWAHASEPEKSLPGLDYSANQMFWISMANSFCTKYRPQALKDIIYTDPYAPNKFRVNGPVSNLQEFSNDFKCEPGTRMNPIRKCTLW